MAEKVTGFVKLQIPAGAANPLLRSAPLWVLRVSTSMQFLGIQRRYAGQSGTIIPVEITIYEDKSFTFVCKTPPAAVLIKEKLGIKSGSGIPQLKTVGTLSSISSAKSPRSNARPQR